MKFPQLFFKTPGYKKFTYSPRFYSKEHVRSAERVYPAGPELTEAKKIEERSKDSLDSPYSYRGRLHGSFRQGRMQAQNRFDRSTPMLKLLLLFVLTIGLISCLQFGRAGLYGLALIFIPLYIYSKFRNPNKGRNRDALRI